MLLGAEICSFSGLNPVTADLIKPWKSTEVWDVHNVDILNMLLRHIPPWFCMKNRLKSLKWRKKVWNTVVNHQDKESCTRHNGIRNFWHTDAQSLPDLQAIRMMQIIYLCCSLMQPIIFTFGQPCPACNGSFSSWSFGMWQLNQEIVPISETVTVTLTVCLRINTPFSQVYDDLLHSGF